MDTANKIEAKMKFGSFNVENFNSLPANVQDTYNESVTQIDLR